MNGYMIKKLYDPHVKIYFFMICGIISCINIYTLIGGLIQIAGGLFYIYLFYKGELKNSEELVLRVKEEDLENKLNDNFEV